jgi:hypothetical protein
METSTARRTPFSFPVDRWHRIIALLESVPIYRQLASDLRASVAVATRSDTPENAHESLTLTTESAVHADAIRMAYGAITKTETDDRREAGFAIGDRVRRPSALSMRTSAHTSPSTRSSHTSMTVPVTVALGM